MKKTILGKLRLLALALVASVLSTNDITAQTMSGNGTKAWFGATNWTSPAAQPTTNGNVIINATGALTINMNSVSSVTLSSFTAQGSSSITMNSSGTATITTNSLTINRSFSFSRPFILTGTGTVASSQTLTCAADLTLNSGATLTVNGTLSNSSNTITVKSGALLIFGSGSNPPSRINVEAGGEVRFTGSGTVTGLTTSNIYGKVSFQGTRSGASGFNATYQNGSTLEYKGSSAQTAYYYEMKSSGISNIIIDNSNGVNFASSLPPSPTINGTLTLTNGVLNFGDNVSSKITFTGTNPIVRTNGSINASGTYATLIFNNASGNFTLPNNLFNNTTITRLQVNIQTTGTLTLNNQNLTVSQLLLSKGHLAVGSGNLTFGGVNTTFGTSTLNSTSMIVTPNAGYLCYSFPVGTTSPVLFPLGETTGMTEYTPLTFGFSANSAARTIGFKITDGVYSNTGSVSDYLTRYFTMYATSAAGTYEYTLATKYNNVSGDVIGTESAIQPSVYEGSTWNLYPGAINTSLSQVEYLSATETTGPIGNGYIYMGRYVTEGVTNTTWYLDADNDGYYTDTQTASSSPGDGWTSTEGISGDCDDNNPAVWRSGSFYYDGDGDGYAAGGLQSVCYGVSIPFGYSETSLGLDCDDTDPAVWQSGSFYYDGDGDGYAAGGLQSVCYGEAVPLGYIEISIGPDCDDDDETINPGAVEICYDGIDQNCNGDLNDGCIIVLAKLRNDNCGSTLTSINEILRGDLVSPSVPNGVARTGYRFRLTNITTNAVREVERPNYIFQISTTDIAEYATVYTVEVAVRLNQQWMPYGEVCTVVTPGIPSTAIAASSCGTTLVQMNNIIRAEVIPGAVNYEYEVSLIEGGVAVETTTLVRSAANFNLLLLSGISIKYGAEYSIRARVEVSTDTGLQWSVYGAACSVYTSAATEAQLDGCGSEEGLMPSSLNTVIYASPVGGATQYRFTLSDGMGYNQVYTSSTRTFRLSNFNALSSLTPGAMYSLSVETLVYGFYYTGKDCNITVPGGSGTFIRPVEISKEETTKVLPQTFKAIAYPNPYKVSFGLDVQTASTEKVSFTVYDMTGRLLEASEVAVTEVANYQFGDRYPSGIYNVIVTQGEETRVVRVVKQ